MMEGVWDAETSTLYVDTDLNTISVITHAPIKSVNGVAYSGSVADGERYNSTIDLRKYNIPQTHILNLSATGEGAAELPPADPADFAFVLPNNLTYDGSPKEVTVKNTSNKDYGDVTVTYMQNGKVLDGAPIEPGDYSYTVTVAGSAQYAGGTVKTGSFRIIAETTPEEPPEQPPQGDSTEFSPLQTVAIVAGTTAWFAGSAVMGYEAVTYSILADLLPKGTPIPRTREQLAVLLWSTAGKPEPAAPAVYSDVAEPDTAKAARWAVEAGLLPDMGEGAFTPGRQKLSPQRAFSIVLHPGAPGGAPCGAQHLLFRLGKLFQGGFPAQSGALVRAALQIGKAYRAVGAGVAGTFAALVRFQPGGGVVRPTGVQLPAGAAHHVNVGDVRQGVHCFSTPDGRRQGRSPCPWR